MWKNWNGNDVHKQDVRYVNFLVLSAYLFRVLIKLLSGLSFLLEVSSNLFF